MELFSHSAIDDPMSVSIGNVDATMNWLRSQFPPMLEPTTLSRSLTLEEFVERILPIILHFVPLTEALAFSRISSAWPRAVRVSLATRAGISISAKPLQVSRVHQALMYAAKNCRKLTSIKLCAVSQAVSDTQKDLNDSGARVKIPVGFAGIDFITVLHNFRHLRKLSLPPFLDIRHIDIFEYLGQHKLKLEHVELHTLFPITSRPSQQFMLKPFKDVKRDRQRKKRSADFYARKIRKLRTLSWRASRTSKDKSLKPVFSLYGSFRLESLSLSNIIVEFSEICEKNVVMWSLHTLRLIGCGLLSRDCHTIARAFPRLRVLNLENNELVATSAIELVISAIDLRELHLAGCSSISSSILDDVLLQPDTIPSLRIFNIPTEMFPDDQSASKLAYESYVEKFAAQDTLLGRSHEPWIESN